MTNVIVIPAFNEEKHIKAILEKTKTFCKNIIVVDDGSSDNTYSAALTESVIALRLPVNMGKGVALKAGCDFALKLNANKIVVMDADGQHDPSQIPTFLKELDKVDIVFGYRILGPSMPKILRFGNNFINNVVNFLFKVKLKDTQSGFRSFTSKAYQKVRWQSQDYSMESEMIANVGIKKLRYSEIPIQTIYNDRYKGTTVIDGIKIVFKIIKWRFC
jgi:UDP-N-acetylglucosamine---dolichyl-phosphate N-acetylglucosaminyltransferase